MDALVSPLGLEPRPKRVRTAYTTVMLKTHCYAIPTRVVFRGTLTRLIVAPLPADGLRTLTFGCSRMFGIVPSFNDTVKKKLEHHAGFEPAHSAWKADMLTVEHQ